MSGRMMLGTATRIEFDDPLKLMDPNGPETFGKVGVLQAHVSTVPGTRERRRPLLSSQFPGNMPTSFGNLPVT